MKPFVVDFDLVTGICESKKTVPKYRHVTNLKGQFADPDAEAAAIENGDPLLYEFYGLEDRIPEHPGDLLFGSTKVYPGKIGSEYYMTMGHFHTVLDTAEVYYCLSGSGGMLMETPEGETQFMPMAPGDALYVPGRWAHRSVNTGSEPFVMFFVFPAHAGHDYGTIKEKGFRKIVAEQNGKPVLLDNPRWK
ncbi:MAG: glucose-6-phosphate isomerase [Eubacteriales bacterium]|nr:glucose-6-phosphate isomerase [Eubacteriales bacterium]